MDYIVITEYFNHGNLEYWYYGTYNRDRANEVAAYLGDDPERGIYHAVIPTDMAENMGVNNLPSEWI